MTEGFDPSKSRVSTDTMEKWRNSNISGDLTEVPGIGEKAAEKLADHPDPNQSITNTYQLFGAYLNLKGVDDEGNMVTPVQHADLFWHFLKGRGITAHRSAIVLAISEKAGTFFPGIYDPNVYDEEED